LLKVEYTLKLSIYPYSWFKDCHTGDSYLNYVSIYYSVDDDIE